MKKFTITIISCDHAGTLTMVISLFLKSLRLRSLASKCSYTITGLTEDELNGK